MSLSPGKSNKSFKIALKEDYFRKGDVLETGNTWKLLVTKVYKRTWWKRFLLWLGFKVIWFKGVKVKEL